MDRRYEGSSSLEDHRGVKSGDDEQEGLAVMDAIVCQLTGSSEAVVAQAHAQAAARAAVSVRPITQPWD